MPRRFYLCREPDATMRHAARFCSLGPLSERPIAPPCDRRSRGGPSERLVVVDLVVDRVAATPDNTPGEP